MKLTAITQVTLDGVMQGNGVPSDDRRIESWVDSKGVTIQVYRRAGRPRYATA